MSKTFDWDHWAEDGEHWDTDHGRPGKVLVACAIQFWSIANYERDGRNRTVAEAAEVFNISPLRVIEAVTWHYWMFLTGPSDDFSKMVIEHEGE